MNLQIFDFNNFFKNFINSPNIIKTSFDIKLDCLKSKNKFKQMNLFSKIQLCRNLYKFINSRFL